jgi:hypothetical protein
MGKRRAEHSFEENPFVDDFLEWMGSSERERSVDALDRVYAALENADVDARQRKIVWDDGRRLSIGCPQNAFMPSIQTCPEN